MSWRNIFLVSVILIALLLSGCGQKPESGSDDIYRSYFDKAINKTDWMYCDLIPFNITGEYSRSECFDKISKLTNCNDSDNGIVITRRGKVIADEAVRKIKGTIGIDECADDATVIEFYCKKSKVAYVIKGCGRGWNCVDGACVRKNMTEG